MEIIQDRKLSKNLGLFIEGIICKGIKVSDDRVDTKFYKMKTVSEFRDFLRMINVRKHPLITAYRNFISETGLKPHRRLSTKDILRLLGLRKRNTLTNSLNDITDAISLTTLVPVKAINLSMIRQPLIIRHSRKGEVFRDPRGIAWYLRGTEVVISDSSGNLLALIPFWISLNYLVKNGSNGDIGLLAFGIRGIPRSIINKAIQVTRSVILSFHPTAVCSKLRVYQ